jgi:hypothetical protein
MQYKSIFSAQSRKGRKGEKEGFDFRISLRPGFTLCGFALKIENSVA